LEAGSFQLPSLSGDEAQVQIDGATFASLLAGIDFTASRRGWYRRKSAADGRLGIDRERMA
jgi:transposase